MLVAEALPKVSVRKATVKLGGIALTLNPDLAFGNSAVGDVKYRLSSGEWDRPELYQIVAFATGFRVKYALLLRFREPAIVACPALSVGDLHVSERTWIADPLIPASVAAAQFEAEILDWVEGCALAAPIAEAI
jgi:hypothetical protein